ncbi:hypothetical protein GCM10023187_38040 [Nibrella viscosa]|uniref:Por secretion system C-terminal sorting domain-containing protein n=1 Tax=Nibrella viscosa TaxID=1084524 RepID=A0ABP8KQD8_9BACT
MKLYTTAFLKLMLLLFPVVAWAQIQVSFPVTRAVFQRNTANNATIRITGTYTSSVSRIEAKVSARDGQGTSTDWQVIQPNPQGGTFAGDLTVQGGWYNLEVRGISGEQQVGYQVIERVGVGEVFVIAGQSNAQGINRTSPPATDDRVNAVNYYDPSNSQNDPPFPQFQHLNSDIDVSPRGIGSWAWGMLGDQLARRLNVPILFFNAAWSGTPVRNWRESIAGGTAYSIYVPATYPVGQPYGNLRIALQFYCHMLGVRAVLWHQGEADNFANTSTDYYASDLSTVINRSRQDSGKNIAWVIARASHDDMRGSNSGVINGQNQVIAGGNHVFPGPNTDVIQIPRSSQSPDDVHFAGSGLIEFANAWNSSLNDAFFANAQPFSPAPSPAVSVACADNNSLRLTVNGNFSSINWNTGENSQTIVRGPGYYQAKVKDGLGNTLFSAPVRVSDAPSIAASGPTTFCAGGSVTLRANYTNNITWSNNFNGSQQTVNSPGSFFLKYRDVSGCEFTSGTINVAVNPLPAPPSVNADGPTTFCQGESTFLAANAGFSYNWSNGDRGPRIEVRSPGTYSATATDQNGCTSPPSSTINIVVNPLPPTPVIATSGPTTFCADQNVTLTATQEQNYVWESGQSSRSITVNRSGNYVVRTRNVYNCLSAPSNVVSVVVNPLPPAPSVTANGRTTFCDGDQVTLSAESPLEKIWNTQEKTPAIRVTKSGNYTARVIDNNGCFSPPSNNIRVDVKPLPSEPIIKQVGTYTLEATGTLLGDMYFWHRDNDSLGIQKNTIKATQAGSYSARSYIVYSSDLTCYSTRSAPFQFVPDLTNQGLSIYPNPSPTKEIIIETFEDLKNAQITVYTLLGQEIFSAPIETFNERKRVDLMALPTGTFIIQVRSASFNVAKRVILGW